MMAATTRSGAGPLANILIPIEGRPTNFLVDTGACRSVIREAEIPDPSYLSSIDVSCVGVDGQSRSSPLTRPLQVGTTPALLARFVVSNTCPLNLLGADVLSRLQASIMYNADGSISVSTALSEGDTSALCSLPILMSLQVPPESIPDHFLDQIPSCLWSTGPEDVGRLSVPPVVVLLKPGAVLPRRAQYPLKPVQTQAISEQIEVLLGNGALIPCTSPCNTPLFPIKKKTPKGHPDKFRLVQDLRAVNEATVLETPLVPNPHTLLSGVPPSATIFTVIDLANAFFSVPLDPSCQYLFAFTHASKQYTWGVLPQGAQNSPNQFTKAMSLILSNWPNPHPDLVVILQYVDDLLVCAPSQETAEQSSVSLLVYLAQQGCKASKEKLQWCSPRVVFLGHCISHGAKHITQQRVEAIQTLSPPSSAKALHAFLGLISYCRAWIPVASLLMQPLYDNLPCVPFALSEEALTNFSLLKKAISTAPALGLPDYGKPFKLFISETQGHASGVLTQSYGLRNRPIGYYSARLDSVARGGPSCLRAVFAAQALLDKTSDIVLGYPLQLLAPHDISAILNQVQPKHISSARHLRLQCSLLLPDNVTLLRCQQLNPATLLPLVQGGNRDMSLDEQEEENTDLPAPTLDEYEHDCFELMKAETTHLPSVLDSPIPDPQLTLYVDGSRFADSFGNYHTGYAVTTETVVMKAASLPASMSAQEAELYALTVACQIAEGQTANIYTDSRYALGVAQDFGVIWKTRGFLTTAGTPVKHGRAIDALLTALQLPEQVAILKVKAHGKRTTPEARGNYLADETAKQAAMTPLEAQTTDFVGIHHPQPEAVHTDLLKKTQTDAADQEKTTWNKMGAVRMNDLWTVGTRPCLPRALYPAVVQWAHGPTHLSKTLMNSLINKHYVAPGITTLTNQYCKSCHTCLACNPGRLEKTPPKHSVRPLYPFQRIQIDHIQMPKSGRFEYALVVVDMFSGWPEAYPVANQTAKTTAKKLLLEVVCRFGVPEVIESDQGPAFTATITKEIWKALGTTLAFHTPYHPQSSGKVERMNQTLKTRMLKMAKDTGLSWPESLPIALFSVRYSPRGKYSLSPFEILFGTAPRLGCYYPQQLQLQSDTLVDYVTALAKELTNIHARVYSSIPDPDLDTGTHSILPGDWVMVKKFLRKHSLEPRYDGPFQVLLTTATSVKLAGKNTWIHASHCKKAPVPEDCDLPASE
ncbi:uncharacterized protein LOC120931186 [Rana temporaria]|uniref:uncharacterized protein LOC120931186 n=1 Tax=Rana temporaria TaxID=8407 RepID=UPI001AAC4939|nr:uncharacterized protein LOC120931186 [Rana temporaria]